MNTITYTKMSFEGENEVKTGQGKATHRESSPGGTVIKVGRVVIGTLVIVNLLPMWLLIASVKELQTINIVQFKGLRKYQ